MSDINVLEILDQPDGSALMNMDLEPEATKSLVQTGLRYMLNQMMEANDLDGLPPNTFSDSVRGLYLSDAETNILLHLGVVSAIRTGMGDEQNQEEDENRG